MFAEQLKCGQQYQGQRIVGMRPGQVNGRRFVRVQLADRTWSGKLFIGRRVAGMAPRTDFPAGPVGAGRGSSATRVGWGDGEDRTARHARFIDGIVYGVC